MSGLLSSAAIDSTNRNLSIHTKGHKRSNSSGTPITLTNSSSNSLNKTRSINALNDDQSIPTNSSTNYNKTGPPVGRRPDLPRLSVPTLPSNQYIPREEAPNVTIPKDFNAYLVLESNLQPIQPDTNSIESMKIFEEHKRLSQEFLKMKMEVTLLTSRKQELENSDNCVNSIQEYFTLKDENDSLLKLRDNLSTQINNIKRTQRQREASADGDWVLLDKTDSNNLN